MLTVRNGARAKRLCAQTARLDSWCRISAHVNYTPLGFSFNGSLRFRWQLQNCGLLTIRQGCQQHDLAVWKLQCIVMGCHPQRLVSAMCPLVHSSGFRSNSGSFRHVGGRCAERRRTVLKVVPSKRRVSLLIGINAAPRLLVDRFDGTWVGTGMWFP